MASFNLADYETVEERIRRFYKDYPTGRIITKNLTTKQDRESKTWVVKASIVIPNPIQDDKGYHEDYIVKATGLAYEIDSTKGPQQSSALEVCETSSIGRALANAGYSGNKRASREEMEKVARAEANKRDWIAEAEALVLVYDLAGLRKLYSEAVANRAPANIIEQVKKYGADVASGSDDSANEPQRGQGVA